MSDTPLESCNRREHSRISIVSPVKYRVESDEEFDHCIMLNASYCGVLISLDRLLEAGTPIMIRMESERDYEGPIDVAADIVRRADTDTHYVYHYGCKIRDVTGL